MLTRLLVSLGESGGAKVEIDEQVLDAHIAGINKSLTADRSGPNQAAHKFNVGRFVGSLAWKRHYLIRSMLVLGFMPPPSSVKL